MHFCMTVTIHTKSSSTAFWKIPPFSRYEAAKKLIEAAGGKLISMYSTAADGPGVLVIFDVPDPSSAPAISDVVAAGAIHNVNLTRLWTQASKRHVRLKIVSLPSSR